MTCSDSALCRTAVARPRLIELAGERWQRRVVTIVGGVGLGKSTLLAQMSAEHSLAPRGTELFVQCISGDESAHHVIECIAGQLLPGDPEREFAELDDVLAEIVRRSPTDVCLVLDDVHLLTATPGGQALLDELIGRAPIGVHLVLASRRSISGLSGVRATGDVVEIGGRDLLFTRDELAALAHAHGADPELLVTGCAWPAVASITAAYCPAKGLDYVSDQVLDHLDADERRVLAIAADVGRFDAALLGAAIGSDDHIAEQMAMFEAIPLVHQRDDGDIEVDELWGQLLAGSLCPDARLRMMTRAVVALTGRGEYDRAFELCARHGLWDAAAGVLATCCRRGHAHVPRAVLAAWLDAMPAARWENPEVLLLRGLLGRLVDPFGAETADLLRRAADRYRATGDVGGEIAAASELTNVLRNQGVQEAVPELLQRAAVLHADGHAEVDGLVALGRGLLAEFAGDDRRMAKELESVPPGSLSREWQAVVDYRLATVHLTLGNTTEMLDAAKRCASQAVGATLRHVDPLARWYAGDPRPALASCDAIIADTRKSRVDALALGAFATMVLATAGRIDEAEVQLAAAKRVAQGPVALLMQSYIVGIEALVAIARGDDSTACEHIEGALAAAPLDGPRGWQLSSRWLALAYVLSPANRQLMDDRDLGPLHAARLGVARMVVAAREGTPLTASHVAAIQPNLVATTAPLPWAMILAGRLAGDGHGEGRLLAESLFETYGSPARDALRAAATHADRRVADGARQLLKLIALAPDGQLRLGVLGPTLLHRGGALIADVEWQRERVRSLLAFLVLRGPVRREQIIDALWPELDIDAADRNLRVTLTYLQRVLEPDRQKGEAPFFIRQTGSTLSISGAPHLTLDAHKFDAHLAAAEDAARRGTPSMELASLDAALDLWRGDCLADVSDESWARPVCDDLSSNFVRAAVRAGELHLAAGHTATARRLARRALAADAWSEPAYRVLVAAALADNDRRAAMRAMNECEAMLAELGVTADPTTEQLCRQLDCRPGLPELAHR